MTREIEFRGWDVENNRWVYGYYVKHEVVMLSPWGVTPQQVEDNQKHYIIYDESMDWNLDNRWLRVDVDPASVGQWTGVFDNNKKRVYDGDRLEFVPYGSVSPQELTVSWSESEHGWWMPRVGECLQGMTIVGNKYEKSLADAVHNS